jgi:hypothetical protein
MSRPTWNARRFAKLELELKPRPPRRRHGTKHRRSRFDRLKINPDRDRGQVARLRADMVAAFTAGDLDLYWQLDRELRSALVEVER